MTKHTSRALFAFVLMLGLCATVGLAEVAIQFHSRVTVFPAIGMAMIISLWLWSLLPRKVSAREQHREGLIMEHQSLLAALESAIRAGDIRQEEITKSWLAEVEADPDFAHTSFD